MPRIDPIQLLKCLSVLLSPTGGIKSKDELQRLARLMTKFSKKLVSKCIYIQILKCTDTELLGVFMASGGWRLVHMWLTESIVAKNWPLVRELLELLLLCPVDIERLKTNNCPKLVKELSKDGNHLAIRALASKLVEQWLKTVKGEIVDPIQISNIPQIISDASSLPGFEVVVVKNEVVADQEYKVLNEVEQKANIEEVMTLNVKTEQPDNKDDNNDCDNKIKQEVEKESETLPVLKITVKDGKQMIAQVDENEVKTSSKSEKSKHKSKDKSSEKSRSSSKSSSSKHSSKSHSSSSDKHKNSSSRSSSSPSRHHSKDRSKDKDKEKRSSHSSSKSSKNSESSRKPSEKSSSGSKSNKEEKSSKHGSEGSKNKEKDDKNSKETLLTKSDQPSIHKLGKIPKLSDAKKEKPSISIEVRKPDEPKPKTVKTFHSKFRSHGLEEEVKPPPSRASLMNKKVPPVFPPTVSIPKRPSPVHNETPPEKKAKTIETIEKPGAIKLIPAKAKPMLLLESDMFMDALNASATPKKEPKKRKRRTSGSKDGHSDVSPPHTPSALSSPSSEGKSVPPRFYQDTLDTEEEKDKPSQNDKDNDNAENNHVADKSCTELEAEPIEISEPHTLIVNGLKGVLCYHKRKGPKKSIKWKPEGELEEIQYFELDETERVNVTKTFTDMKNWERTHEREAFQKGRNLSNEDVMEEKTNWRPLILFDAEGQIHVDYGKKSKEKDIQAIRQKGTLQPLYFHKSMIPDSPFEPEPETHVYSEPSIIPLEDVTGNTDNISDFRNMPWPEPKGNAPPPSSTNVNVPPMFQPNMPQFANGFPNPQFPGVPQFQGSSMIPSDWPAGVPPMMGNGLPPGAMGALPPGAMPPGLMVPPDSMIMGPDMFGAPNPMFGPVPPEGFNMMENMMGPSMFPPDFNMAGQGPPGPDAFSGGGGFRGAMRGRGAGGHWRGKNSGSWDGPQRGRGGGGHSRGGRKAVCIYFQRKGSCRQGDNCTFLHPGVNCPY